MPEDSKSRGVVYLIGAGPGDPGLVTVRGLELIRAADVILYDNLAAPALLVHASRRAETIYVGKKRARHARTQDGIHGLMIEKAREGKIVVRLKGGDPYVFGRGGEEGEALADAGVRFEVVPGVSSVVGAAAYTGIPLTHRTKTSAVTFVTAHDVERIDWKKLGTAETLVLFMGLTTFGEVSKRVIAAGRSPETPAAAVRWATRPDQQTIVGTLADLAEKIRDAGMKPPALVIVGEVVALRDKLNWFERLPLFGVRVLVTRAPEQAAELCERLRRLGAEPLQAPTIAIVPPEDQAPLDAAIARLETYDWLIFTSANGVERFFARLWEKGRDARAVRGKIAAIGPATADALARFHLRADLRPEQFVAESLVAAFASTDVRGARILLPRAAVARDVVPRELRDLGAEVDVVAAYRTVAPGISPEQLARIFEPVPDWITFTSSSTVTNFVKLFGKERLKGVRVASIGPITTATLREEGLRADVQAERYTADGLVEAIVNAHGRRDPPKS